MGGKYADNETIESGAKFEKGGSTIKQVKDSGIGLQIL
jgi:hypothetical protein